MIVLQNECDKLFNQTGATKGKDKVEVKRHSLEHPLINFLPISVNYIKARDAPSLLIFSQISYDEQILSLIFPFERF